ncbi:putative F-box domain-containing protein [Seiridium cardinale]|uniref:F-box domain-containing protein n=1 Tax=Seiridium cardinale TaxID=138064 RepID=A0ABR2X730_9PEZI
MGQDLYCAFCGTVIGAPWWQDDDFPYAYDTNVLPHEHTGWMDDVRVIGENPDCPLPSKVYISGPARHDDSSYCEIERGTDPHAPADEASSNIRVYDLSGPDPFAVPFHNPCLELFRRCLAPGEVDNEILYETMKSIGPDDLERCLLIDYGPVTEMQDQYWVVQQGHEEVVTPFTSIPWVAEYYASLPIRHGPARAQELSDLSIPSGKDAFSRFPTEIILLIMSHLDMREVHRFQVAVRSISRVELDDSYWKNRLLRDMPWLFDFPLDSLNNSSDEIDWTKLYRQLMLASESSSSSKVRGLVNRKRIWGLCSSIAELYISRISLLRAAGPPSSVLEEVLSTPSALLMFPEPKNCSSSKVCLIDDFDQLLHEEPVLSIHWTVDGALAGLEVRKSAAADSPGLRDDVVVPVDDWVTGFIMYSTSAGEEKRAAPSCVTGLQVLFAKQNDVPLRKMEGNQRLFRVSSGHCLVGFNCHTSDSGQLAKLSLLQQPTTRLPYGLESRVKDQNSIAYNGQAGKYLWMDQIPGSSLTISGFSHGYWAFDLRVDASAMEALILGESEEELADITAIGADVHFGGFEVQYANRPPRLTGPRRHAMQYLHLDGRGGERIVCMYWTVGHIPVSVRFVTNRGRQLVVGHPSREQRYPSTEEPGYILAGCFGHWSKRDSPKAVLQGVGGLYLANQLGVMNEHSRIVDSHQLNWTPEPPSLSLIESGRIWGGRTVLDKRLQRDKTYPASDSVVTWLDCRRPLDTVKVTLCHGTREQQIPLVAINFKHAALVEGVLAQADTIGPSAFSKPPDTEGTGGHHWCWCSYGDKRPDELDSRPHHIHETWQVGGQRLRSLNVWLSEEGALAGMQLVAADESESPIWGYCSGQRSGSINFLEDQEANDGDLETQCPRASGLKFFLGNNERHVSRDDTIVVAVQALVEG